MRATHAHHMGQTHTSILQTLTTYIVHIAISRWHHSTVALTPTASSNVIPAPGPDQNLLRMTAKLNSAKLL